MYMYMCVYVSLNGTINVQWFLHYRGTNITNVPTQSTHVLASTKQTSVQELMFFFVSYTGHVHCTIPITGTCNLTNTLYTRVAQGCRHCTWLQNAPSTCALTLAFATACACTYECMHITCIEVWPVIQPPVLRHAIQSLVSPEYACVLASSQYPCTLVSTHNVHASSGS